MQQHLSYHDTLDFPKRYLPIFSETREAVLITRQYL